MKEYKYISLNIDRFFNSKSEDHRAIIDEEARKGYRYAGYIPTLITDYGRIKTIDLIFESDAEETR
ncbi:MAG: DUF4177 domain-containing protein [Solobacterium sp.]|nr:DUF4177 domain-containing protein [Solobacterium sp.]